MTTDARLRSLEEARRSSLICRISVSPSSVDRFSADADDLKEIFESNKI